MKHLMRVTVFGVASLFFMFLLPQQVFACSGYEEPYTLEQMLEGDVFVRGHIVEVDSIQQAGILRVEQYFKGDGPEYLLISRSNNALYVTSRLRGYDTGCLYDGTGGPMSVGADGYYSLKHRTDGTWDDNSSPYSWTTYYSVYEGLVARVLEDPDGGGEHLIYPLPVEEFESLVIEATGTAPLPPDMNAPMPLKASLIVTTESGKEYFVPIDYGSLVERTLPECEFRCSVFSPDGSHIAEWISDSQVKFTYPYSWEDDENYDPERAIVAGEEVWFSPDSNRALVRDESTLHLYTLDNRQYGGMYGAYVTPVELAEIQLTLDDDNPLIVRWSGNSTTFAYQDSESIFRFDLSTKTEPEFVISLEEIHNEFAGSGSLMDVSTTGRYMRFGSEVDWSLLDTSTGETFYRGIASPDEGQIIRLDSGGRPTASDCQLPLNTGCGYQHASEGDLTTTDWGWLDNSSVYVVRCQTDDSQACTLYRSRYLLQVITERTRTAKPIVSVAHEPHFDYFAVALADSQVTIAPKIEDYIQGASGTQTLDLADQLDSPIQSIRWGTPIYFTYP